MSDPIETFLGLEIKNKNNFTKWVKMALENLNISFVCFYRVMFGPCIWTTLLFFVFQLNLPQILFLRCIIRPLSLIFLTFGEFDLGKPISSPPTMKCHSAMKGLVNYLWHRFVCFLIFFNNFFKRVPRTSIEFRCTLDTNLTSFNAEIYIPCLFSFSALFSPSGTHFSWSHFRQKVYKKV